MLPRRDRGGSTEPDGRERSTRCGRRRGGCLPAAAPAGDQRIDWFWTAERWAGTPRILEPAKCSGLDWFPLDAPPAPMPPYERRILAAVAGAAPIPVAPHDGLAED